MFAAVLFSGETKGGVETLLVEDGGYPLVLPLVPREETEATVDTRKWRHPDSSYKKPGPRPITHPFNRTNPTPAAPEIEPLFNRWYSGTLVWIASQAVQN